MAGGSGIGISNAVAPMVVPAAAAEAPREVVADPTGQASAQALAASVLFGAPASAAGAVEHLVSTREDLAARRAVIPALPADAALAGDPSSPSMAASSRRPRGLRMGASTRLGSRRAVTSTRR